MKGQILSHLRAEDTVVSGEMLSARLGVSRVSIWKHIKALQELGYPIMATSKGYRLLHLFDALYPWEFPGRESKIRYFQETESTMDNAKDLARKGCPDFTVVIAGRQRSGRGRLARVWHSPEGGLYFTVVLRPQLPPILSPRINLTASVCLARTLRRLFDIEATVKWPNDILAGGLKLAGMLSELEAEADRVSFINIGIGINANNDPTPLEPKACSLKNILGREISKKELLSQFLDEFETRMKTADFENSASEWKKYSSTLNRLVKIVTRHEESQGTAIDVDENGALILALEDGSTKKIFYGDCFYEGVSRKE